VYPASDYYRCWYWSPVPLYGGAEDSSENRFPGGHFLKTQNILILFIILLITGGLFYFLNMPDVPEAAEVQEFVWMIEMEDIDHITLELPREGKSQSFIKISVEDEFPWYFDDEARTPVDSKRWGGGIPLLLSGPGADRVIAEDASPAKLEEFGLTNPKLRISLLLTGGKEMNINVGDATPNGAYYYVQAPSTTDIALVDYTWYDILAKIIIEPPYVPAEEE
jgi:hypothetical protein